MKALVTALLILICSVSQAQSLLFLNPNLNDLDVTTDTVYRNFGNDTTQSIYLHVNNISSTAMDVEIIRYELNTVIGTENNFCWEKCYGKVFAQPNLFCQIL